MLFRSKRFLLEYLLALLGTICLMQLLFLLPGLRPGLAVPLVLPILIAAVLEGRAYARKHEKRPPAGDCWGAAVKMAGILMVVAALPCLAAVAVFSEFTMSELKIALSAAVVIPLLRYGFYLGVRSGLKARPAHEPVL